MEGAQRRVKILEILQQASQPVSGTELSRRLGVSRQVVVQDIALLRAVDKNILSTNKGYLLYSPYGSKGRCKRSIRVNHSDAQILDEFYSIVDLGGRVLDVVVEHDIYGQITVDLVINTRRDANEFLEKLKSSRSRPLKELTNGVHYHTVEADNEKILDEIEHRLSELGIRAKERD